MRNKYFNDAIIGNDKIRVSFTETGELIRLFYSMIDYKQFFDFFHVGLKVNDSALIYLHDDINNVYTQEYIENSNVLTTNIYNKYFNVKISQTDFVPIGKNFLVRDYVIKNENTIDLDINFLLYSKLLTNINNDTSGLVKNDILIQYNHDFSICTFSNKKISNYQINGAGNTFMSGVIGGKDYIGMSPDSAISYNLNKLAPGQEAKITIYIYTNRNKERDIFNQIDLETENVKKLDVELLKNETINYWQEYLKNHDKLEIKNLSSKIKKIYYRTILLYPLLINEKTGGISAGMEVDEGKSNCGRYSYCWTRDAIFITEALDLLGFQEETTKFYSEFCRKTQYESGMWEQRFYTDGRLAPSWGYQIDETASVIYGVYEHYKTYQDKTFLADNLEMLEKATSFLKRYVDDIFGEQKFIKSYDLWEEFEGITLYSLSSIYSAFNIMIEIYNLLDKTFDMELQDKAIQIKKYCEEHFYDEERKSYVRNEIDKKIDISLIGAVVPFRMFSPNENKVESTIEKINSTLRTYTGGYVRYENDHYMGGSNPWPIATLWMAWYYLEVGNYEEAIKYFDFVVNSASQQGFLGEQVNNETMKPCWVIGLNWSHSMFIITLKKLLDKGLL